MLTLNLRLLPSGLLVESRTFESENGLKICVVKMALSCLLVDINRKRHGLKDLEGIESLSRELLERMEETRGLERDSSHAVERGDGVDGTTEFATQLEATELLGIDLIVDVEVEPRVLERLRSSKTLSGVGAEQIGHQIFGLDGHGFPSVTNPSPLSVLNVDEHLLLVFELERVNTGKQDVEDDSEGPQVDSFRVAAVRLMAQKDELAGHVGRRSDQCGHLGVDLEVGCKSKVGHFDDGIFRLGREQKILGLEITMADTLGVQVSYGSQDLLEETSSFLFTKVMERDNAIEKLSTVNTVLSNSAVGFE